MANTPHTAQNRTQTTPIKGQAHVDKGAKITLPGPPMVSQPVPAVTHASSSSWNATRVAPTDMEVVQQQHEPLSSVSVQQDAFYCKLCHKAKPFPTQKKLDAHIKRSHKNELEDETLQLNMSRSMDDSAFMSQAAMGQQEASGLGGIPAPMHRQNNTSANAHQIGKRGGRGGNSSRGKSPGGNKRSKKGMMPEGLHQGESLGDTSETSQDSYSHSPMQTPQRGDVNESIQPPSMMSAAPKQDSVMTSTTARPIGQVPPAPRNNSQIMVRSR